MKFEKLKKYLNIKDLNNIEEVKKSYKNFAKKYHPDISNSNTELFTEITTLYNEYIQIYKNFNFQFENNDNNKKEASFQFNKTNNQDFFSKDYDYTYNHFKKKEKHNNLISIDIIIPVEELLFKSDFEISVNNKIIKINNEEIKHINDTIIKDNLKINYTIRMQKNIYLDNFGRIIKETFVPFPLFIFGGKVTTGIGDYIFDINLEKNHKINEILEIKSNKFKRLFFLKLLPLFPNSEELNETEKTCLKNLIQKKFEL